MFSWLALVAKVAVSDACVTTSITPPEFLPLGGYTDRKGANSEPGGQELFVRSVAIGDRVLAVAEMLTIPESLRESVEIKLDRKIPFILVATHTHCAPDSQMLNSKMTLSIPGISNFRRKWMEWYADRIAKNIQESWRYRSPIQSATVQIKQVPLVRSRRKGSTVSPQATRFNLTFESGTSTTIDIFGAHPTLLDEKWLQLNGDWPGAMMRKTEGLCMTGAIGSASPSALDSKIPPQNKVNQFAAVLDQSLASAKIQNLDPKSSFSKIMQSNLVAVSPPNFAKDNGIPHVFADKMILQFAPVTRPVTAMAIGNALVVFVSGEPSYDVVHSAEIFARKQGFKSVSFVSHADGWTGYVLPEKEYNLGGYEGNLVFYGPKTGQVLLNQIKESILKIPKN